GSGRDLAQRRENEGNEGHEGYGLLLLRDLRCLRFPVGGPVMKGIDLVRKDVRALRAYEEEAQGGLDLMANTSLFGPNPAIERALAKVRPDRFSEYPTLLSQALREAVARKHGVAPEMVVTGNGSNEVIDLLCRCF